VRRARIENARRGIAQAIGECDRLARGGVRETEDDDVDGRHHVAARVRILAQIGRDALHRDAGMRRQALPDPETGRSGFAIDED